MQFGQLASHLLSFCAIEVHITFLLICITLGGGYLIDEFLSAPFFKILGRLTYIVYLFHFTIVKLMWRYTEQPVFGTKSNHIQNFVFVACISFALAAFLHITVELPFAGLWSIVSKKIHAKLKTMFEKNETKKDQTNDTSL